MSEHTSQNFIYEKVKEFVADLSNISSVDTPTKVTLAGISMFVQTSGPSEIITSPLVNFIKQNKQHIFGRDEAIFINFDAKTGPIRQLLNLISFAWKSLGSADKDSIWEWLEYFCEIIDKETTPS